MDADLLADMAIFAAVVEQDSFSAAAELLNMSKSNVSRRVAALEERMDVTLMHRTTRRLSLTESGRIYYDYCARVVAEARDADHAIRAVHSRPSGVLNVSLPETLGRAFILPMLPEFLRKYPDVRLNLTITSRKVDFHDERCDVAVRKGEIEDDALCAVPLGSSTQYLYASPSYLAQAPDLDTPDNLDAHSVLTSQVAHAPVTLLLHHGRERVEKRIRPRLSVKDHEALRQMTVAGLGVALLPAWMTHDHVRRGTLVRVLDKYRGPSVEFNLVFQPHRRMAPSLLAFVEFLKERLRLNRPWEIEEEDSGKLLPMDGLSYPATAGH